MARKKTTSRSGDALENPGRDAADRPAPEAEPGEAGALRPARDKNFLIVGIGASAGGLEAMEQFFRNTPPDSGLAFVVVQHQDPHRKGDMLVKLLQNYTAMPVVHIADGMEAEPNRVYVIPPNYDLELLGGVFQLLEPVASQGKRLPIDFFLRSLAEDQGERAAAVILSGTASDGSLGVKMIRQERGLVVVQEPRTAQYDGMPVSAIATRMADYVLPPQEIPQQLLAYARRADGQRQKPVETTLVEDSSLLQRLFLLLRSQTGHDFSYYKRSTISRRIERRMVVNQVDDIATYLRYLQQNPVEVETLFRELLIGVTNFFRDPAAFKLLEQKVIPDILARHKPEQPVRVWVPGCATGEEAYSLAILLREKIEQLRQEVHVQVFATDIDSEAIALARMGVFPDNIAAHVSPDRLQRFFTQEDRQYQIKSEIREMIVFAVQDVLRDPPFSRLELISCRNLLIYLQPAAQRRLLHLFHYGLRPQGYLFLGNSESISEFGDLFTVIDRKWKIFQRTPAENFDRAALDFSPPSQLDVSGEEISPVSKDFPRKPSLREMTQALLLESYAPPTVVVNEAGEALYFHGRTGRYLEPPRGDLTWNILELTRPDLKVPLTTAIHRAVSRKEEVVHKGLRVRSNGDIAVINLIVRPISEPSNMRGLLLVIFDPANIPESGGNEPGPVQIDGVENRRLVELEQELRATREYLQITTEELETSNEELKSTNEELQSANEELQSTNEELETSKEELQSVNEELITVNSELQTKIEELSKANNDMTNLLASTEIGTIFLDNQLRVKGFTPAAARHIKLITSDIGRPVSDIVTNLKYGDLTRQVEQVLADLAPREMEVSDTEEANWYRMRVMPYRTVENVIDGVVITFVDITPQKRMENRLRVATRAAAYDHSLVLRTDTSGRITYASAGLVRHTGYTEQELLGQQASIFKTDQTPPETFKELWQTITSGRAWQGEFCNRKKDGSSYWEQAAIIPDLDDQGQIIAFIKLAHDITPYKQREQELEDQVRTLAQKLARQQKGA